MSKKDEFELAEEILKVEHELLDVQLKWLRKIKNIKSSLDKEEFKKLSKTRTMLSDFDVQYQYKRDMIESMEKELKNE